MTLASRLARLEEQARRNRPKYADYPWYVRVQNGMAALTEQQREALFRYIHALAAGTEPDPADVAVVDALPAELLEDLDNGPQEVFGSVSSKPPPVDWEDVDDSEDV